MCMFLTFTCSEMAVRASNFKIMILGYDAWCGVAHGCTRKLGMKICGKLQFIFIHKGCELSERCKNNIVLVEKK